MLFALGLGFVFGALIVPALGLLLVVAVASGSYGSSSSKSKKPWRGDWDQKIAFGLGTVLGLAALVAVFYALLAR